MLCWRVCVPQVVVFTRDSSGGRVTIDSKGRPVVHYWPCATTRRHLMEVSAWLASRWAAGPACLAASQWLAIWLSGAVCLRELHP